MFDNHYGKYQNMLAALAENWNMDGDYGDVSWSAEGEGSILWKGYRPLSWTDARFLMGETFECSAEELDELAREMVCAGVLLSWDDRGFVYAQAFRTAAEVKACEDAIDAVNVGLAVLEQQAEDEGAEA